MARLRRYLKQHTGLAAAIAERAQAHKGAP